MSSLENYLLEGTQRDVYERYASFVARAETTDFGELDNNIVVVDTEATGFSYAHDELTQIAAARIENGEVVERFLTFVNPGKPIPEDVVYLTDIHDEDVAGAPSPDEALGKLVEFVGDAKVVAHNVEFDRTFTTNHPSGYPLLENTWIDSLDLARIVVPRLKSHRLIDIVKAFDGPLSTHRADADVTATCWVFRVLLAGVLSMPPSLVREIARLATEEQWSTQVVFSYFAGIYERVAEDSMDGDLSLQAQEKTSAGHRVPLEKAMAGTGPLDLEFNLREMRKARVGQTTWLPKEDARDIAADPQGKLIFPSTGDMDSAFSQLGLVGRLYDDYEPREEQRLMAKHVANAFARSENLAVEAGTGVGKSMAYLVPSAMVAQENNITVGVATKTNALLDQLMFHELPALAKAFEVEFPEKRPLTSVALKGYAHYPCLRKIEGLLEEESHEIVVSGKTKSQAPALAALLSFIEQTDYDDIDALKIDYRSLPRHLITSTSRDCLRRKCPYFKTTCFVQGLRAQAETADIVVTNHSLLFCDLVADGGLLPPIRYWVVDEAHGVEEEARKAFSITLDGEEIMRLVSRVDGKDAARNTFLKAERKIAAKLSSGDEGDVSRETIGAAEAGAETEGGLALFYRLMAKARSAGTEYAEFARAFVSSLKDFLSFDPSKKGNKGYENTEVWISDSVRRSEVFRASSKLGKSTGAAAESLVTACQEVVGFLDNVRGAEQQQRDIATIAAELKDQINAIEVIFGEPSESYAYSATLSRKKDFVGEKLQAIPLNVGERFNETLYARTHAVVYASATMTVGDSFETFEKAVGLNSSEYSAAEFHQLRSSFDYDNQMTIYVVSDMPEPAALDYLPRLQELLVSVHVAQEGSMLTLFTNRREMERCFEVVQPQLKERGMRLICQKWGVSVKGLRDDFLKDEHLSLFALKSFWEGFDAPGSTLRGVVIPKLPFSKPTDPLSCERAERDDRAWWHYVLPAAVLETKQAAGRLIRKADDEGVLILADSRLLTKSYGRTFLNSMPSRTVKVMKAQQIAKELASRQNRR